MPTTTLRIPSVQSPPVPLHIAAVRLIPTALILAATLSGFTGCASVGLGGPLAPAVALGAVVLGPILVADFLSQSAREKTQKSWESKIESELRPLLPLTEAATSPAPYLLSVRVDAHNTNYGKKIVVEAVGDFDPETAKRFAGGVRLIAWRCSDDVRLRLYTNREGPAGVSVKDSVSPEDYSTPSASQSTFGLIVGAPFRLMDGTLRGRRELARYEFHPSKAVAEKLRPLLPRTALLSRINSVVAAFFEKKPSLRHKPCCGVSFPGRRAGQATAGFSGVLKAVRAWCER